MPEPARVQRLTPSFRLPKVFWLITNRVKCSSTKSEMLTVLLEEKPIAALLARKVEAYFQDEEHRKQFEEWYRQKYGKDYEWR